MFGAAFAVALSAIWTLELRWFVVTSAAIVLLSIAMMLISVLRQLMLLAFFLAIPLASIERWLFFGQVPPEQAGNAIYSGALGIGPIDLAISGLAVSWFIGVFVVRDERLPVLQPFDLLVLLVPLAYLLSLIGTPKPMLGLFSVGYLLKHLLVYFYVSRHVGRRELNWLLFAVLVAILFETFIALLQTQLHLLEGLARDKGAGSAERQSQYEVPGIETRTRAEGTAYDSHAFGLYLCMMLPFPLVLIFNPLMKHVRRMLYGLVSLAGLIALVLSFSRAAWLSFLISNALAFALLRLRLGIREVIRVAAWMLVPLALFVPWGAHYIYERFASAPAEIMSTRFEQWAVAWTIWLEHPFFGFGAGNYMEALSRYNFNWALELPVHNVPLWVAAETGLFGVLAFFGLILAAMHRFWRVTGCRDRHSAFFALAGLTGLVAYLLDGLTDPLFREPVVFMMFWVLIALAMALPRIAAGDDVGKSA